MNDTNYSKTKHLSAFGLIAYGAGSVFNTSALSHPKKMLPERVGRVQDTQKLSMDCNKIFSAFGTKATARWEKLDK